MDGQIGIREETTEDSFLFPVSHKSLILQVKKWLMPKSCAGCGESKKPLKACGKCRQFSYCNKECQVSHWNEGHKKLCKHTEKLKILIPDFAEQQKTITTSDSVSKHDVKNLIEESKSQLKELSISLETLRKKVESFDDEGYDEYPRKPPRHFWQLKEDCTQVEIALDRIE